VKGTWDVRVSSFSEIEKEFIERVHAIVWCNMATLDTRNRLRSRIVHPIWEGARGWATARPRSLKAKHLAHNSYVSLAYVSEIARPVYVDCKAEWEIDPAKKRQVWELFRSSAPPLGFDPANIFEGVNDPEFGVLRFTPWRVDLFDIANSANRRIWIANEPV
jgi:general stress protein 26